MENNTNQQTEQEIDLVNQAIESVIKMRKIRINDAKKNEYLRTYYEKNKDSVKEKNAITYSNGVLEKLNNGEYTRMPYSKIKKYNIKYDAENKKYYI
jgi:hypothetical protein